VPVAVLLGWLWIGPVAAWLLIGYPANVIRIRVAQRGTRRGWRWSTFMMLSKFPEFQGIVEFWGDLIRRRDRSLIEYK
jgi:hypothetical protein